MRAPGAERRAGPRERLLSAVMDHVTRHGIGELSLRQLAKALGTSHRMLVYHFGSKEALLTEVVRCSEAEQRAVIIELAADAGTPPIDQARQIWSRLADPEMWPRERLFFEIFGQALQGRPHASALLDEIVEAWLVPLAAVNQRNGMAREEALAAARLGLAVTRGLLLDLLATGDRKGVDAAMEHFLRNHAALTGAGRDGETSGKPSGPGA